MFNPHFRSIRVSLVCLITLIGFFNFWSSSALNNHHLAHHNAMLPDSTLSNYSALQAGKSSYYGHKFHNRKTASGERFDLYAFTAAHKKLPFGTIVKVTNQSNQRSVLVRINDRGPFVKGRIIDLSYQAARTIGALGIPKVEVEYFEHEELRTDYDSTYFVGYSVTQPLLVIKQSFVNMVDSSSNWNAIANTYMHDHAANKDMYIFMRNVSDKTPQYYIGNVNVNGII